MKCAKSTEPSPEASIDREALVHDLDRVSPLHRVPLEKLTQTLDAFEELATLATEANLRQVNAQHEFEELLNQLTDCRLTVTLGYAALFPQCCSKSRRYALDRIMDHI